MKPFYTLFLLVICAQLAVAQNNEDYYNPSLPSYIPPVEPKINKFKTDKRSTESFLAKHGGVKVQNRWYVGLDGFIRSDKNTISDSFEGLVGTGSTSKSAWGASLGWVHNENWTVELSYTRSAIHNDLIINGYNPLEYKLENDKNNFAIRGKRRLMFGKSNRAVRRSAFWIGGGLGLVPNSGKQIEYMEFSGYASRGRQAPDTLFMKTDTHTAEKITAFADVTAEYTVKVAKGIDMSFYARKQWGFGNSLTTDMTYYVNKVETATASIKGNGTGMSFGVSLRYVFSLDYDFEKLHKKDD